MHLELVRQVLGCAHPTLLCAENDLPTAIAAAFERLHTASEDHVECRLSDASSTILSTVVRRLGCTMVEGLPYRDPAPPISTRPPFAWPRMGTANGRSREDEVSGYASAVRWVQKHVAPAGVAVLDKHLEEWLSWCV